MEENKQKVKIIIWGAIVLLVVMALWIAAERDTKMPVTSARHGSSWPRAKQPLSVPVPIEQLKENELLEVGTVSPQPLPHTHQQMGKSWNELPPSSLAVTGRTPQKTGHSSVTKGRSSGNRTASLAGGKTAGRSSASSTGSSDARPSGPLAGLSALAGRGGNSAHGNENNKAKMTFSPYLKGMNKKEAEALEKTLAALPRAVERAVLQATLPQNKKNANIEKYLNRRYGDSDAGDKAAATATASGPFAGVARQLARQKGSIVSSMKNTYGDKAASQAGKVMDSFQNELMGALNQPGQTPEQLQQKTQQISQKYNQQLQDVSRQSALEQMKQELEARDNALLRGMTDSYGRDVTDKMRSVFDKYRELELAEIARPDLTQEEYTSFRLKNERARDEEIAKLLKGYDLSMESYRREQQQWNDDQLKKKEQETEEGKRMPQPHYITETELKDYQDDLVEQTTKMLEMAGPEGKVWAGPLLDTYNQQVLDTLKEAEDVNKKNAKLRDLYQQLQTDLRDAQLQFELNKMRQSPEWKNATPEQRAEWEQEMKRLFQESAQNNNTAR